MSNGATVRKLLLPLSWLYGAAVGVRNFLFTTGILGTTNVGVPVISVGNITAGGTGKTPLVERIVEHLLQRGHRVAVVSRGYGRESRGVVVVSDGKSIRVDATRGGDEPVQIARRYPDACVVVGERRVDAAREAVKTLGAQVIVLDDGFQHRYIARNIDIVVVDTRGDLTREPLLPAGRRREFLSGIRRATLLAFSKVQYGSFGWAGGLRRWYDGPEVAFRHAPKGIHMASDHREMQRREYSDKDSFAFSGIGDHASFVEALRESGFTVKDGRQFRDHHRYTPEEADAIVDDARRTGATLLVTTEKDMMRIFADDRVRTSLQRLPLCYVRLTIEILSGGTEMFRRIDDLVGTTAPL